MAAIQWEQAAGAAINIQENSGQLAIGKYVVQIGSVHGGEVNIAMPAEQPQWQPRPLPVLLRPRRFTGLLDRQPESRAAATALQSLEPLEFFGSPGQGKTSLLRHLAQQPPPATCPDGVIYLSARQQPQADLLQFLFEAFFESNIPAKASAAQIRHGLSRQQAFILLDDVDLPRAELDALLDHAPEAAFILASPARMLWSGGQSRVLPGLPPDDALALLLRGLERPLTPAEAPIAPQLCALLQGHPLHLLQIAGLARDQNLSLVDIAAQLQPTDPQPALAAQLLEGLSAPERKVVGLLAALNGTPLSLDHLAQLAGLPDAAPVLATLQQRQIIHSHSPRYSLTPMLVQHWPAEWNLSGLHGRLLAHFTRWAERQSAPEPLLAEADTLRRLLSNAADAAQWPETLRLARAIESGFSLGARWGAWAEVLHSALQAANALGDRAAIAWAWHQLGTRALCLDDAATAQTALGRALRMRQALGDHAGAEITRHNLNLLLGPPLPPQSPPQPPPPAGPAGGGSALPWPLLAIVGLLFVALMALLVWLAGPQSSLFAPATQPPLLAQASPTNPPTLVPVILPAMSATAQLTPTLPVTLPPPPIETLTATPLPSATDTPLPPDTPLPSATATASPTATPTPSLTPTPTSTRTATPSATPPPVAWISPESLQFGTLRVGDTSRPQAITLANSGGGLLSVLNVTVEGEHAADFLVDGSNCLSRSGLPAAINCTVFVRFRPTAAGDRRASALIFTNSFNSPRSVFLSGVGQADPLISLDPNAIDFGEQPVGGPGGAEKINVINAGHAELVIGSIQLNGNQPDDFDFEEACLNRVLAPGASCSIAVWFNPLAPEVRTAELILSGNARNSPQRILLRGSGVTVQPAQPDLIIPNFEINGPARLNQNGEVLLPVALLVFNQGDSPADRFKVSMSYSGPDGEFAVAFTVPGQNSQWYPFTDGPLAAGSSISFSGFATFPAFNQGQTVSLTALADSCSGDEMMPSYCRVEESSETNNVSPSRSVTLPLDIVLK